jgi:hypothetical protein
MCETATHLFRNVIPILHKKRPCLGTLGKEASQTTILYSVLYMYNCKVHVKLPVWSHSDVIAVRGKRGLRLKNKGKNGEPIH